MSARKASGYIPGVPYTPAMITHLVRQMPTDRLRTLHPHKFHMHPVAEQIVPLKVIREIVDNELASRR